MIIDEEAYVEHHGVKGQRWGVRRSGRALSKGAHTSRTSSDFKTAQKLRNKKPHELSNKQLKTLNERLNLEQQHARLNPSTVEKGRKKAKIFLDTIGLGVTAFGIVKSPAGKAAIKAGRKFTQKKVSG